jgi:hypothetical protein
MNGLIMFIQKIFTNIRCFPNTLGNCLHLVLPPLIIESFCGYISFRKKLASPF